MKQITVNDIIRLNEKYIQKGGLSDIERKKHKQLIDRVRKNIHKDLLKDLADDEQLSEDASNEITQMIAEAIAKLGVKSDKNFLEKLRKQLKGA